MGTAQRAIQMMLLALRPLPLDADGDGLIEVSPPSEQLNAIRYDLDGNGIVENATNQEAYNAAFGTGICTDCTGYELMVNLDFKVATSYTSGTINMDWTTGSGWEANRK